MSLTEDFSKFLITNQKIDFASKCQRVQLKKSWRVEKKSQLIEKWHRFSLGVCEKSHTPGTDRVKELFIELFVWASEGIVGIAREQNMCFTPKFEGFFLVYENRSSFVTDGCLKAKQAWQTMAKLTITLETQDEGDKKITS